MKSYHRVAKYRGTAWEDDERQEAYLIAWEVYRKFPESMHPGQVGIYIQKAVQNRLFSWQRYMGLRDKTQCVGELPEQLTGGGQEEYTLGRQVAAAVVRLPEKLRAFPGLTEGEGAAAEGVTVRCAKKRRVRAEAMLREMLND